MLLETHRNTPSVRMAPGLGAHGRPGGEVGGGALNMSAKLSTPTPEGGCTILTAQLNTEKHTRTVLGRT